MNFITKSMKKSKPEHWDYKKNLATIVEGDQKASLFNWGVGKGDTRFHGLPHFTIDTYLILLSVKQGGIKYHF